MASVRDNAQELRNELLDNSGAMIQYLAFATANGSPRPARSTPSARKATRVTMRSGRRSSVSIRPNSSATLEWVDWSNRRRLFEAHGQIPPAEFEELHYRQNNSGRQAETRTKQPS